MKDIFVHVSYRILVQWLCSVTTPHAIYPAWQFQSTVPKSSPKWRLEKVLQYMISKQLKVIEIKTAAFVLPCLLAYLATNSLIWLQTHWVGGTPEGRKKIICLSKKKTPDVHFFLMPAPIQEDGHREELTRCNLASLS